jgi:hypothetical protein
MDGREVCEGIGGHYRMGLRAAPSPGKPAVPPTCTVVVKGLKNSTVPHDRNQCLAGRLLSNGRTGADCYKATPNSDGTVTTSIVLDDYCIVNAAQWYGCIVDHPVPSAVE